MTEKSPAEEFSVTPATVVRGLGYPNGREEISSEPTGWLNKNDEILEIEKKVSRETIR